MANALYGKGREKFLEGSIHWGTDEIRAILVDTALYTVVIDTHEFLSDIAGGARVDSPLTLGTKTTTLGVADAADLSFTGLVGAPSIEALVIYKHGTVDGDSPLIAYIDTASGLPVASGATQVDVTFDSGANKIFKL